MGLGIEQAEAKTLARRNLVFWHVFHVVVFSIPVINLIFGMKVLIGGLYHTYSAKNMLPQTIKVIGMVVLFFPLCYFWVIWHLNGLALIGILLQPFFSLIYVALLKKSNIAPNF